MADGSAAPLTDVGEHRWELRKEALTMALYVAICLMASLIVIPKSAVGHTKVFGLIWGVTLGLALAHWFAFRVSARMVGAGTVRSSDIELIGASCSARAASHWWSPLVCSYGPTPRNPMSMNRPTDNRVMASARTLSSSMGFSAT